MRWARNYFLLGGWMCYSFSFFSKLSYRDQRRTKACRNMCRRFLEHLWPSCENFLACLFCTPIRKFNKNFQIQGKTLKKRLEFELDFECLNNWAKDSKILKSLPLPPPIFHATESSSEFWPCCLFPVLEEEENRARVRWKSRERFPKKNL